MSTNWRAISPLFFNNNAFNILAWLDYSVFSGKQKARRGGHVVRPFDK